jgi:hypothetical protein
MNFELINRIIFKIMKAFRIYILLLFLPLFSPILLLASEERLTLNAKINGQTIRLAFDTGMPTALTILSLTAKRLSLKKEERNGRKYAIFTIYIAGHEVVNAQALVTDSIPFPDIDGVVGWPALLGNIWRIQWENMSLSIMSSIPKEIFSWKTLKLDTQSPTAAAFLSENSDGLVYLDTGHTGGIALSESRWNNLVQENPHLPRTIKSGYLPAAGGIFSTELTLVNSFRLGFFEIPCVMIEKNVFRWPRLEAVLGIEALKHFDIVFELINAKIHLKERAYSLENFRYNRLGATFLPSSLESDRLVARVLINTPAHRAGLRSGDILKKVDNIDMTRWRSDPEIWKKDFWEGRPGTKYIIEVERGQERISFPVSLEEILAIPGCAKK